MTMEKFLDIWLKDIPRHYRASFKKDLSVLLAEPSLLSAAKDMVDYCDTEEGIDDSDWPELNELRRVVEIIAPSQKAGKGK